MTPRRLRAALPAILFVAVHFIAPRPARAQERPPASADDRTDNPASADPWRPQFSVLAGLTQWVLFRGGNVAVEYKTGRLAFEYSHGQGLDLNQVPGVDLTSAEQDAGARVRVPWTTGFGAGVRVTEHLDVLVEAKAHRFEVTGRDRNAQVAYTAFSVGPSVFYSIHLYKGMFLQPNVRFWPNVASTLPGNHALIRQPDGSFYDHQAHAFGLFANANLGWRF
ncbi:MAG TPA: hypothetical protein VEU08_04640 [Vicinamibacterales bacterium]|nr:hypothetical protein [Vicinamibacterales bacterium]